MQERLQKLLAAAGVASRRAAEQLILAGRVTVNGRTVRELGARADAGQDDIRLDGRPVQRPAGQTYLMMHKPAGYTSTAADPHALRTVMQLLPPGTPRVYPVGRLDRESEGLLLFTDDGELAQRLTHPRYHLERHYAVLVRGTVDGDALRRLREGAVIDGRRAIPAEVDPSEPPAVVTGAVESEPGAGRRARRNAIAPPPELWLRVVLTEGRKRQIRLTCERAGLEVVRLLRMSIGPLSLGDLAPGKVRSLRRQELATLRRAAGLPVIAAEPSAPPPARRPAKAPARPPAAPAEPGATARRGAARPAERKSGGSRPPTTPATRNGGRRRR